MLLLSVPSSTSACVFCREESTVARKDEMTYGLNLGKAPVGSDLKGAPAAQAPRIKLVWTRNPENMAAVGAQCRATRL